MTPLGAVPRDPSLPFPSTPLAYTDVYVDDHVGATQDASGPSSGLDNRRWVRRHLLHAVDDVFRPLSVHDSPVRREPVSLKKLHAGNCSWGLLKLVLGWIIDTVNMTISLPPHRIDRLAEIIDSFPATQKSTSIKRWHEALGELCSMALALPGSRNVFSAIKTPCAHSPKAASPCAKVCTMHSAIFAGCTGTSLLVPRILPNLSPCPRLPPVITMRLAWALGEFGSRSPIRHGTVKETAY
jgi:hypothetical protein